MITPTVRAIWTTSTGAYDGAGQRVLGQSKPIMLCVTQFRAVAKASQQDGDGSASRGAAEETATAAKFLIPTTYKVKRGDRITIQGLSVMVDKIWPHYSTLGVLDHYECEGSTWR